jgi:phosphoglycerate kinase
VCPCLFLLGGAKFQTKLPLLEKYLEEYDYVFVGGALANDIFKAQGLEVGQSLVSDVSLEGRKFLSSEKLLIPVDVVVDGEQGVETKLPHEVLPKDVIVDCGPATISMLESYVTASKTVLWNGPFGNYEAGFKESTEAMAKVLGNAKARTIVGGGDTVAAIENLGLNSKFDFVSTGGGAMLTFLEHGTTPVLETLISK